MNRSFLGHMFRPVTRPAWPRKNRRYLQSCRERYRTAWSVPWEQKRRQALDHSLPSLSLDTSPRLLSHPTPTICTAYCPFEGPPCPQRPSVVPLPSLTPPSDPSSSPPVPRPPNHQYSPLHHTPCPSHSLHYSPSPYWMRGGWRHYGA